MVTTGAGVIFRGSGFYETDYKKRSQGDETEKSKTSTDKSSGIKTETKSKSTELIKEQKAN